MAKRPAARRTSSKSKCRSDSIRATTCRHRGLCSTEGIMGVLDVPDLFLDPCRVQAALIWFGRGYVEYKFPNNAKVLGVPVTALEFALELSSEVPGTNADWPSDISLWVNDVKVGTWTS